MITFLESKKRYQRAAAAFITVSVLFLVFAIGGSYVSADLSAGTGRKLGGTMFNAVVLISHSLGSAIEPISILLVEALISLLAKVFPDFLGSYTEYLGFMNNTIMSLVIILLFVILKVPKMFGLTRIAGIAVSDIENKGMALFNFSLPFLMFLVDDSASAGSKGGTVKAGAAVIFAGSGDGFILAGKILICTLIGIYMLLTYYVMRTVIFAGDVLITLASPIPGVSLLAETAKTFSVILLVFISIVAPWAIIGIYVLMLIGCIILFKKSYNVTYYFRKVYLYPFFVGPSKECRLITALTKDLDDKNECMIPAFIGTSFGGYHRFERCYVHLVKGKAIVEPLKKKTRKADDAAGNKKDKRVPFLLEDVSGEKFKIRKGVRYIEIFMEAQTNKKKRIKLPKRQFSVVIGREYSGFYPALLKYGCFEQADNVPDTAAEQAAQPIS